MPANSRSVVAQAAAAKLGFLQPATGSKMYKYLAMGKPRASLSLLAVLVLYVLSTKRPRLPRVSLKLMLSLRSFISVQNPNHPVQLPSTQGGYIGLDELVRDGVPELRDGSWFWNHPLLGSGHLQTMYAAGGNFEHVDRIYYGRRLVTWPDDGGTVSIDYVIDPPASQAEWQEAVQYAPVPNLPRYPSRTRYLRPEEITRFDDPAVTKPLVISLHGLTGGSHESYVRATITELIKRDFDCLVIQSRGCNRTPISTPQLFCAVFTDDIRRLVKRVRTTQPNRKIYLVGYSLGGSILANYLGQEGDAVEVDGACVVANPWDLNVSNVMINESWIGRNVYSPTMAKNLMRLIKNNSEVLQKHPHFQKGMKAPFPKLISDFDDNFTAPFFGFNASSDYYRNASSVNRLATIRTPTLILNSKDDPIVSDAGLPYKEARRNPYTLLATTTVGGHLGWFQPGGRRWFPHIVANYFEALHKNVRDLADAKAQWDTPERLFHDDRLVFPTDHPVGIPPAVVEATQ